MVVRSPDPEVQLQGLRTALSLSLGDRPARVYLVGAGLAVLDVAADSEAGQCLVALREARVPVLTGDGANRPEAGVDVEPGPDLLGAIEAAAFQQTF